MKSYSNVGTRSVRAPKRHRGGEGNVPGGSNASRVPPTTTKRLFL